MSMRLENGRLAVKFACLAAVALVAATAACGASDAKMAEIRTDAGNRHFTVESDYSDGLLAEWTAVVNVTFGEERCRGRLIYRPGETVILEATLRQNGGSIGTFVYDPEAEGMRTDPRFSQCYESRK